MAGWLDNLDVLMGTESIAVSPEPSSVSFGSLASTNAVSTPAAPAPAAPVAAVAMVAPVSSANAAPAASHSRSVPRSAPPPAIDLPICLVDQSAVCLALTPADAANIAWLVELAGEINAACATTSVPPDPSADIGLVRAADGQLIDVVDKTRRLLRGLSEVTQSKYAAPILAALAKFRGAVEAVDASAGWRSDRYEWPSGRD